MKNYSQFQPDDFVQDPYFRKWALGELPPEDHFWATWQATHPEQEEILEQAKSLVIALRIESAAAETSEIKDAIQQILDDIEPARELPLYRRPWIRMAASVALVVAIGLGIWRFQDFLPAITAENDSKARQLSGDQVIKATTVSKTVNLADGSRVVLEPSSRLTISGRFGQTNREVKLAGEAFFEVAKNPEKPFLVYSGNVVTKVLGTRFRIKAYESDANVSVAVQTGEVTVFKQKEGPNNHPALSDEIILTPNQQAIFVKADERLVKTLVEKPVLLSKVSTPQFLSFTETPIPQVFASLEKAYGVKIIFDAELLRHCNLTGTLTSGSFYEKLTLICETIQARYEIVDGQIVVYGKGC